jgi:cation/acetate symporter
LGFLGAVLGSWIAGRDLENEKRFDAFLPQVYTGIVSERSSQQGKLST